MFIPMYTILYIYTNKEGSTDTSYVQYISLFFHRKGHLILPTFNILYISIVMEGVFDTFFYYS